MAGSDLVIKISGDIKNYTDKLREAEKQTEDLSGALKSVATKATIAFAAVAAEIGFAVSSFKEAEKATLKLSQAMQNQGVFSKSLVKDYQDMATEIQGLTGISDEQISDSQRIIQGYIGQREVTKELTLAIANLSVAKGIDLASASELVGKTIQGETNALKRQGIEIDITRSKTERMEEVVAKLNQTFAGTAVAGADKFQILIQTFDDFQEEIGKHFAPALDAAAVALTKILAYARDNEWVSSLAAAFLASAAAVSAVVAGLASLGVALVAIKTTAIAAGVAFATVAWPVAAVGILVGTVAALAMNWDRATKAYQSFAAGFGRGGKGDSSKADAEAERQMQLEMKKTQAAGNAEHAREEQQRQAAARREAIEAEQHTREMDLARSNNELKLMQSQEASDAQLEVQRKEIEARKLMADESFIGDREALLGQINTLSLIQTEADAARYSVDQQKELQKRATQAKFLNEQIKFGTAYATINKAIYSQEVQAASDATAQLSALANSKNDTLKKIGKAAAITQITIDTARGAMAVYANMQTAIPYPPVSIPLGIAAAAAMVAFGAERIGQVQGAAQGGLIRGGIPGVDSVPVMAQAGELIAPKQNFDEVVNAVADSRNGSGGTTEIILTLRDDLVEFVEAQIVRRLNTGTSQLSGVI